MTTTDVAVEFVDQSVPVFNAQDLAELGAMYVTNGFTTVQARAMVAFVQSVAAQTAMAAAPKMLEEVRKIQEARVLEILQRIRLLPTLFGMNGYVQRDRVLQIIQDVSARPPRQ